MVLSHASRKSCPSVFTLSSEGFMVSFHVSRKSWPSVSSGWKVACKDSVVLSSVGSTDESHFWIRLSAAFTTSATFLSLDSTILSTVDCRFPTTRSLEAVRLPMAATLVLRAAVRPDVSKALEGAGAVGVSVGGRRAESCAWTGGCNRKITKSRRWAKTVIFACLSYPAFLYQVTFIPEQGL